VLSINALIVQLPIIARSSDAAGAFGLTGVLLMGLGGLQ